MATKPHWEHFEHRADIGVAGYGNSLAEAYEQAALALTAALTTERISGQTMVTLNCEAPGPDYLLVEWLNAIIYEMATRNLIFGRFSVETDGKTLTAKAWGEPINPKKHQPAAEAKGATYTALDVGRDSAGGWHAKCVVDV